MGWLFLVLTLCAVPALAEKTLYENNFEKAALDQAPDDFLVLDGDFAVKQGDGNKFLELPGAPLDTFGVLFGPTTNAGVCVSARIYGTGKGRRYPSFGVGLNGPSGYKLKVSPAKGALEIYKGDESVTNVPFAWKSGSWTMFKLEIRPVSDQLWKVEGKAWPQTESEPADWMIGLEEKAAPHPGRASLWGAPLSGTPIRFDDLVLTTE
ncbi:MAG TPA: hypothetical protein VMR33_20190 [Candidatus Baltobacteraceae bacterium]|nr:hypothetical protein [Candidatus Baltobacteraceae bacterium]